MAHTQYITLYYDMTSRVCLNSEPRTLRISRWNSRRISFIILRSVGDSFLVLFCLRTCDARTFVQRKNFYTYSACIMQVTRINFPQTRSVVMLPLTTSPKHTPFLVVSLFPLDFFGRFLPFLFSFPRFLWKATQWRMPRGQTFSWIKRSSCRSVRKQMFWLTG